MTFPLDTAGALRALAETLGTPTHLLLLAGAALCLFESGVFVRERFFAGRARDASALMGLARRRIDRADVLARTGPMLGLMGTLIPLGPGLSALGRGDVASLAEAVTVAFDTTVLGLAIGTMAFCLARARRNHYDRLLDALETADAPESVVSGRPRPSEPATAELAGISGAPQPAPEGKP